MPVHVVLIGPPGGGKGTQAVRLARRYAVPHISTGDMLRQAVRDGTELGREVSAIMARGGLVGDALMGAIVRERLRRQDAAGGFILDGYPRTREQAETLDTVSGAHLLVLCIQVPDDAIVERLSRRRVCQSCGITQSTSNSAASHEESCPYCGGLLIRREDDEAATVRRRLSTFAAGAEPILAYYRQRHVVIAIDGSAPPDLVTASLVRAIDNQSLGS